MFPLALFAQSNYWQSFVEFWTRSIKQQNSMVLIVVGLGAVGIFIITRAKGKKT